MTLDEIKDAVAKESNHYMTWCTLMPELIRDEQLLKIEELHNEVCKRYAFEVAKASLLKASENADYVIEYTTFGTDTKIVKSSITDESNIVL